MKKNIFKSLRILLMTVLIVAMTLTVTACSGAKTITPAESKEAIVLGTGEKTFSLSVIGYEGEETLYKISTDKTIVGEALLELELIEGEDGPYGLFIKKVAGIRADYDLDKKYWAFYIDNSYAVTGIDATEIDETVSYALKVENA